MATRTVRFDDETEKVLTEVRSVTGLPISEVLKSGLRALQSDLRQTPVRSAYDVFRELDLGAGGDSIASSAETRRGVLLALQKKHRR